MHRAETESQRRLAAAFIDWGIPTSDSIRMVRKAVHDMLIFASGGIRSGVEIAKCIALGATLGGMASPFLKAAVTSTENTIQVIHEIEQRDSDMHVCNRSGELQSLRNTPMVEVNYDALIHPIPNKCCRP